MLVDCIIKFYILDTGTMTSKKRFVKFYGSRPTMIASKNTIEASDNVEDEVLSLEELKKNAREWKHAAEEDKPFFLVFEGKISRKTIKYSLKLCCTCIYSIRLPYIGIVERYMCDAWYRNFLCYSETS